MMLALYKRLVHICARRQHDSRERKQIQNGETVIYL